MKKNKTVINEGIGRKVFVVFNHIFLAILSGIMLIPFLKALAESLSAKNYIENGEVLLWPKGLNFEAYKAILSNERMLEALFTTVFITVVGTAINLLLTTSLAYATSRKEFAWRGFVLKMIFIAMIIHAPMMPNYLYVRSLGLDNTVWAVILPGAINCYNFYVMRTFFMSIPETIIEAARIDGCSEARILFRIVCPLALPSLVTIGMFYGISHWNALQGPLIYLRDTTTLQMQVYSMLSNDSVDAIENANAIMSSQSTRMATVVITALPIIMLYPFLQKYFIKGATLGSVKE